MIREALAVAEGIFRLEPCWVPRSFMIPGRRLRLHPDDLYAFGGHRGGINERWFSSTTKAANGPSTTEHEGLSFVRTESGQRFLLKAAMETAGDMLLGSNVIEREGGWNVLCKFFDNMGPIPHHMHQSDEFAKKVGFKGKPEAYYFPPQYNQIENNFPYTFMGLEPGTTKEDVRCCLENWNMGDNGILNHSRAYRLEVGSGWQVDPGILHAPGSLVTYEPQVASDVFAMFQSLVEGRIVDWSLMTKDVLPEYHHDLDYLIGMLDWNANVNQEFAKSNKVFPRPVIPVPEMEAAGYCELWITYGTTHYSAKELTVLPGRSVTIHDSEAYGALVSQGHGTFGRYSVSAPTMIRFGEMTEDELFICADAAKQGVTIRNASDADPLVILKHFGPGNPDAEPLRKKTASGRQGM
jgi:hypothetical protein